MFSFKPSISIVAASFVFFGCISQANSGQIIRTEKKQLQATGITSISIQAVAGDLKIEGKAGATQIDVVGKFGKSFGQDNNLELIVERKGSEARIHVERKTGAGGTSEGWVDLQISVPSNLPISVMDSSGDIEISGVGALTMTDSSGDIDVRRARSLHIEGDSSGDIRIRDIWGEARIDHDSSGDIEIDGIKGNVVVAEDSSGSIEIENVSGAVEIGKDSSGDIEIKRVAKNVQVGSDSHGDIIVAYIDGDLTIQAHGSGKISAKNIKGKTSLPPQ